MNAEMSRKTYSKYLPLTCNFLKPHQSTVAYRASHSIKLPCQTSFCLFYIFFISLLLAAQHLTNTVVCDSSFLLCVFVYYYCMCLKSCTYIFLFLLGLDNAYLLPSHGSSLICLPFPPSLLFVCCFRSCDVCSDQVFGDACSILPTSRKCSRKFWSLFRC